MTVVAITLGSSAAAAKDAVRKIPVAAYILGSNVGGTNRYTPVDIGALTKLVEHTNRAWGDAGIRLTIDTQYYGVEYIIWDDLNCWSSQETNPTDASLAEWLASFSADALTAVFFSYRTEIPGTECVPTTCVKQPADSCTAIGAACYTYAWGDYCATGSYWATGPRCFTNTPVACTPQVCSFGEADIYSPSMFGAHPAGSHLFSFAHEFAHHFSLVHTHAHPDIRCYDRSKTDVTGCNPPPTCSGPGTLPDGGGPCGNSETPWKNVISYHKNCLVTHAGTYHGDPSDWNSSLSHEQVGIMWRALDEYWDKQLTAWEDYPQHPQYGKTDRLFITQTQPPYPSYPTSQASGFDSWDEMSFFSTGESAWTKGNVRIVPGDFDGDGSQDAIVSASSGPHPGTSYYWGSPGAIPYLTFVRVLNSAAGPSNSIVSVGDFRGDKCDDVLIQTSAGGYEYEGAIGAPPNGGPSSTPSAFHSDWPWGKLNATKVVLGDFVGDYNVPAPLPSPFASAYDDNAQQSYVDALVIKLSGATLFQGSAAGFGSSGAFLSSAYTFTNSRAWAGNVWGDHHDELIVRGPNGLEVFKGQKTGFALTTGNRLWLNALISSGANIELAIGNFTDDHHADFVTSVTGSTYYNGSRLWWGRWNNTPALGSWTRSDLYPGVAKYVVGNVLRGSFDDLVITTSAGSFVYAGQPTVGGQRTFIANAWANWTAPYSISQAEWFGQ